MVTSDTTSVVSAIQANAQANSLVAVSATSSTLVTSGLATSRVEVGGVRFSTGGAMLELPEGMETLTIAETQAGTDSIQVKLFKPAVNNSPLSLSVTGVGSGNVVLQVNLATDASGNITTTTGQLIAKVLQNETARSLVTVTTTGDGTAPVLARRLGSWDPRLVLRPRRKR